MEWSRVCVFRDWVWKFSGHGPFQSLLTTLPIGHHLVEELEEGGAVMRLRHMAEPVGDHVVDGVDRRLHNRQFSSRRPAGDMDLHLCRV